MTLYSSDTNDELLFVFNYTQDVSPSQGQLFNSVWRLFKLKLRRIVV